MEESEYEKNINIPHHSQASSHTDLEDFFFLSRCIQMPFGQQYKGHFVQHKHYGKYCICNIYQLDSYN